MIILGNGTSRKKLNLNLHHETKIGCNAIHRDYFVDYLVCFDKKMVKQALASNYKPVYTRQRWLEDFEHRDVVGLPDLPYQGDKRHDDPFNWGSGPYAVLLGANLAENIKLVGFDLYGTEGKLNNVYADTDGYKSMYDEAVDCSYWILQIGKIFECFPNKKFTIFNTHDWIMPKQWKYPNVSLDTLQNL